MGVFSALSRDRSSSAPATPAEDRNDRDLSSHHSPTNPASVGATGAAASSRGLGLLDRLASLHRPAVPRSLADFHIRPDKPHHIYTAGEHVRGAVVLTVVKPVRITHLVVALHGYVRVLPRGSGAGKGRAALVSAPSGISRRVQYQGDGQASLFQDEQVLSGEGRLEPQRYEFQFNLVFPDNALPSSVDFERGSISYVITATITRPTSIKATTTCDRMVKFEERLDIGSMPPPRPRTIFLEPISRWSRRKKQQSQQQQQQQTTAASNGRNARPSDVATDSASDRDATEPALGSDPPKDNAAPRSPEPSHDQQSVVSGDSCRSASTGLSLRTPDPARPSPLVNGAYPPARLQDLDDKTITATVELQRGGCLPGDMVPVKISVRHIKPIKSMHGIIITLYREAKINPSPPATLFNHPANADAAASDPGLHRVKSRSSLAGLSRSSTGKASAFRKDLSQAVAPLLIDPVTLETSVTVSVRVPVDSFPTIRRVPGNMISFRYQLEVIADLGGRLANQFQSGQQSSRVETLVSSKEPDDFKVLNSWGGSLINTTNIVKERGLVVVNMEVIVGTYNSLASQQRARKQNQAAASVRSLPVHDVEDNPIRHEGAAFWGVDPLPVEAPRAPAVQTAQAAVHGPPLSPPPPPSPPQAPVYVPPPQLPDEGDLTEKERIQRAEQRLLPSQPPDCSLSASASAPSPGIIYSIDRAADEAGPSAPSEADLASPPPFSPAAEDKQEVERQRLLVEASAPPEVPEDAITNVEMRAGGEADLEPSAPVIVEDEPDDPYGFAHAGSGVQMHGYGQEPLPRYQR